MWLRCWLCVRSCPHALAPGQLKSQLLGSERPGCSRCLPPTDSAEPLLRSLSRLLHLVMPGSWLMPSWQGRLIPSWSLLSAHLLAAAACKRARDCWRYLQLSGSVLQQEQRLPERRARSLPFPMPAYCCSAGQRRKRQAALAFERELLKRRECDETLYP